MPATRRASRADLAETIRAAARRHDVDPALIEAMIEAESAWDPRAVSRTGAQGLMQIMPATARDLALVSPFDPVENVRAGTAYLRQMLDRFEGRVELALAAYNAGPSTVEAYGGVPPYPETVAYVRRVLGSGSATPPRRWCPATRRTPGGASPAPPARPAALEPGRRATPPDQRQVGAGPAARPGRSSRGTAPADAPGVQGASGHVQCPLGVRLGAPGARSPCSTFPTS